MTQFILRLSYPWYETPAALRNALAFAKRAKCDRVMLFNCRGHNEPAHYDREEILRRADVMRRAAAAFREAGIGVGINNLATIGMNFSPPRKHRLPFQSIMDVDGRVFTETFCPLDPGFLDYIDFLYSAWAAVGPDEVWVDDDFRYKSNSAQCFCPLHVAEFERITGTTWTRERLVEALASSGPTPNELALRWGQLQGQALLGAARTIANAVQRTNPAVRIGFMGITFNTPFYGSEYLRDICEVLSPDQPPLVRPEYGSMNDESRTNWDAYHTLWSCVRAFGDRFLPWPELEVWPYARFTHSRKVIQMKLSWGAVHGFCSSTLNVLEGNDPQSYGDDPGLARAVARAKKNVVAISEALDDPELIPMGVSVEMSENTVGLRPRPGYVSSGHLVARLIGRIGIPMWPDGGHARILSGNAPLIRQRELDEFARQGLLLDRPAFDLLCAMERDDLLGGAQSRPMGGIPVAEQFADVNRNGRAAGRAVSLENAILVRPTLQGFELPQTGEFDRLSWFVDEDASCLSPAVWTRHWHGGRLAVLPFDLNEEGSQCAIVNWKRKWQLESLLEWLAQRPLPVKIADAPDLWVTYRESSSRLVIGVANYSNDPANGFSLIVPRLEGKKRAVVSALNSSAHWRTASVLVAPAGTIRLRGKLAVPAQEVRLFQIENDA